MALRPDRRGAHRPPPREGHPGAGPRPHAHPAGRPPGRRLPLLGRPLRRLPAHADRAAHRRPRPRRHRGQPHPGHRTGDRRRRPGPRRHRRPRRRPSRSTSGPRWWSTPPASGPTRSAPSTRDTTPTPSGRPRASTSRCPRRPSPATSPRSSRSARTSGRSSWSPGATRSTWAPPTPPGTARSTTRRAPPRTSTTSWGPPTPSPPASSPGPTSPGSGRACGRCSPPSRRARPASAPPTCPAATPCAPRTAAWSRVTGGKLTTYRKMAEDTVDAVVAVLGRQGPAVPHQEPAPPRCARRAGGWSRRAGGAGANLRTDPAHPETTRATILAGRYGTEAPAVLAMAEGRPELLEPLVAGLPYLAVEALWAVAPGDGRLRLRRARPPHPVLLPRRPGGRRPRPATVAALIGPELGWDDDRTRAEAEAYAARVRADLTRAGLDPDGRGHRADVAGRTSAGGRRAGGAGGHDRAGRIVTQPTPVTPIDAAPGRRRRPPGQRPGWPSTTTWPAASADACDSVSGARRRPGRGRPGLVAAGHRLGGGRGRAVPARPGGPAHRHRPGVGRARPVRRGRGAGHPGRRPQRGVRGVGPAVRRRGPRPVRPGRDRRRGRRPRSSPTCGPAPSGPTWRRACGTATGSPSATGRSRWTSRRWAAGWPAGGPASTPTATGRSRTWSSASRWCWPTAGSSAPGAPGPARPPGPTSPSSSWAARAPSGSSPRAGSGCTRCPRARAAGRSGSPRSPTGLDACRRILRRGATPAVLRLYDTTESGRNFDQPDTNVLIVLDEADPALVGRHPRRGRPGVRRRGGPRRRPWSTGGSPTATTCPPWPRCGGRAWWSTPSRCRPAGRRCPASTRAVLDALGRVPGTLVASSHQSHAYTDGACLYFTFAGRPPEELRDAERRDAWVGDYYRRAWDEVTRATIDAGGAISHHHGIGLNRGRFLADGLGAAFDVLASVKDALDPHGILNPGKLGLPTRLRAGALAVSILVVDVGTSGVRGAVVRPDATVEHIHHVPVLPDTPFPGLVEFDGTAIAAAVARGGRPQPGRRRAGRRRRDRQPAGLHPGVGPGHRRARSAPGSAGRTCAPSGPASSSRARASGSPPTPRPPSWPPSSTSSTPTGRVPSGASWPSAPSTPGWPGSCPAASCTSPTPPTPA